MSQKSNSNLLRTDGGVSTAQEPPRLLSEFEISTLLAQLVHWTYSTERGGIISCSYRFDNFADAFSFMTEVAFAAERINHHPEWTNVYDRVDITLTTHDLSGVTTHDASLSRKMEFLRARSSLRQLCSDQGPLGNPFPN